MIVFEPLDLKKHLMPLPYNSFLDLNLMRLQATKIKNAREQIVIEAGQVGGDLGPQRYYLRLPFLVGGNCSRSSDYFVGGRGEIFIHLRLQLVSCNFLLVLPAYETGGQQQYVTD
jgi:hypothetical protein